MKAVVTLLATALLALPVAGCTDEGSPESGNQTDIQQSDGHYLSADDTATFARAYQQIDLACTAGPEDAGSLTQDLRGAVGVARREPEKIYESGNSERAQTAKEAVTNMAQLLRSCGQTRRADALLRQARTIA
jgi:hypothetical protein